MIWECDNVKVYAHWTAYTKNKQTSETFTNQPTERESMESLYEIKR